MADIAPPVDGIAPVASAIEVLRPGWKQLVMLCEACERRKKAPKKFGARKVSRALQAALRAAGQPKTRIVLTTCMGLCPKQALAVAACAHDGRVNVIAWRKHQDANVALQALFDAAIPAITTAPD